METPLRIITPIGMLGYGYNSARLFQGIEMGASAIICDAGSTDSGPQKLALGTTTVPRATYKRDFRSILDACYHRKVKVLVSSAGGDGSNDHVDMFEEVINELCMESGYSLKLVKIYAEIDKKVVHEAMAAGKISSCGAVPELKAEDVDEVPRIVAQMGMEPFVDVMQEHPDYDIIIAGRAYDPSPYAAFAQVNGIKNLGTAYHMGKIMECGAECAAPKAREAVATIWQDKFEIVPLQPTSVCTPQSLASHSLYEESHAALHPGPGGSLDLSESKYWSTEDRACAASNAKFIPSHQYTIKLEGAKKTGFQTMVMGSIRDPILVSQVDEFLDDVRRRVAYVCQAQQYDLTFHVYGKNGTMGQYEPDPTLSKELFLIVLVQAETQDIANSVASMARVQCIHNDYPGQKATAGNFAMPVAPTGMPMGPACTFCVYHLMQIDDPCALFPRIVKTVGPEKATQERDPNFGHQLVVDILRDGPSAASIPRQAKEGADYNKPPIEGDTRLKDLAKIVRSKNAGPYEITFDIIFQDQVDLERVRASGMLTKEKLAPLYGVDVKDVVTCAFFPQAIAFKFTIPRLAPSGGFGERDVHGSQQHVPLLDLKIA
ncbi:MAG: hypothetical protein M1828_006490 [Chrysothrix sp. TS-e1954]|nr:MAG: hypothetical protein M1828_006490 [Chrysothrix sp. TS-e1954]